MNVIIVGWYGTETIGDRAILNGIVQVFRCIDRNVKIEIGSLWPFFTERTLLEDYGNCQNNIRCFDVKDKRKVRERIDICDYIVFGGGPIMDGITHLELMAEIFLYGRKKEKRTIIMGCGLGPLNDAESIQYAEQLFENSDMVFLRDRNSCILFEKMFGRSATYLEDPAIISAVQYKNTHASLKKEKSLICCFRSFQFENQKKNEEFKLCINGLLQKYSENYNKIILWPMHTFTVGGDDRVYANELVDNDIVEIQSVPPSLWDTYDVILKANTCIGMRYHSIVFQTVLNGNNFIIDYTDKKTGKIVSFLQNYGIEQIYANRYANINNMEKINAFDLAAASIEYSNSVLTIDINELINKYIEGICKN